MQRPEGMQKLALAALVATSALVIIAGALLAAGSFLLASAAHSLATMIGAYLVLGIGISAGTVLSVPRRHSVS